MALFIRVFPKELQKKLKMSAAEKEQTLTSLIIEILEKWVGRQNEKNK